MIFQRMRKRFETGRRAGELYGSVVTAARQPVFYELIGVPDTPEGRFELVALHLFLALESLRGSPSDELQQRLIEAFVTDMDDCMREMGVGDLTVPKKVKRAAAAFYERAKAYRREIGAGEDGKLPETLGEYVFPDTLARADDTAALAHYVRGASSALSRQTFEAWLESGAAHRLLDSTIRGIRTIPT